jgi:hypothetical protein
VTAPPEPALEFSIPAARVPRCLSRCQQLPLQETLRPPARAPLPAVRGLRAFSLASPPFASILPPFPVLGPLPLPLPSDGIRQRVAIARARLTALLRPRIQKAGIAPLLSGTAVRIRTRWIRAGAQRRAAAAPLPAAHGPRDPAAGARQHPGPGQGPPARTSRAPPAAGARRGPVQGPRLLPAELAGMIQADHQILRSSPWARARLGLMHGSVAFLGTGAEVPKRERVGALAQHFEHQLPAIEGDAAIGFLGCEEEETAEAAGPEMSPLALKTPRRFLDRIWEEEGLSALPKRKVLKQMEWSVVDGREAAVGDRQTPADIFPITTCEELTDLFGMTDQRTPPKIDPFGAQYEIFRGLQTGQLPVGSARPTPSDLEC